MSLKQDFLSIFPTDMEQMGLHSAFLTFKRVREEQYWRKNAEIMLRQKRIAIIIGVFIYLAFALSDLFLMPSVKDFSWMIRFGVVMPLMLLLFSFSYHPIAQKYIHFISGFIILIAGIGQVIILFHTPQPVAFIYALSIVLIFAYGYLMMGTDFKVTNSAIIIIFIAFLVYLFNSNIFSGREKFAILAIALVGLLVNGFSYYLTCYMQRRNYYLGVTADRSNQQKKMNHEVKHIIKTIESPVNKMFDSINDVVWFIDLNGEIKFISRSVKEFLGYEPEELIGKRAMTLFSTDAYNYFETSTARLYKDKNMVQDTYEYKTKAGLVKNGEAFIKAYSDNKNGEGFIGSTRPITEKIAKERETDQREFERLQDLTDSLKTDNANLITERDDLLSKLKKVGAQSYHSENEVINVVKALAGYFIEANDVAIKDRLEVLGKIKMQFNDKTMSKCSLENYFVHAETVLKHIANENDLSSIKVKLMSCLYKTVDNSITKKINVRTLLEESVIKLRHVFEGTHHIIEVNCPKEITLDLRRDIFEMIVHSLILTSVTSSFKQFDRGRIAVNVKQIGEEVHLSYRDNGEKVKDHAFSFAVLPLLKQREDDVLVGDFNIIKEIVKKYFGGSINIDKDSKDNIVNIILKNRESGK